jgi:hypothetical protein
VRIVYRHNNSTFHAASSSMTGPYFTACCTLHHAVTHICTTLQQTLTIIAAAAAATALTAAAALARHVPGGQRPAQRMVPVITADVSSCQRSSTLQDCAHSRLCAGREGLQDEQECWQHCRPQGGASCVTVICETAVCVTAFCETAGRVTTRSGACAVCSCHWW